MKCSVEKPVPPEKPNAQLIGDEQWGPRTGSWDQELWEGEKIRYKCENESLVIDHTKGLLTKEYQCQSNGDYDTPDNTGSVWPDCTEQPVDPS